MLFANTIISVYVTHHKFKTFILLLRKFEIMIESKIIKFYFNSNVTHNNLNFSLKDVTYSIKTQ